MKKTSLLLTAFANIFQRFMGYSSCKACFVNPLTAGAAYIRVFIFYQHIKEHILNAKDKM